MVKQKKAGITKKLLFIALGLVLVLGIGFYVLVQSMMPQGEERIAYDKEKQVELIQQQLKGLDLSAIRAKGDLILEKTVEELQGAVANGTLTYEELTAFYLDRILTYDM